MLQSLFPKTSLLPHNSPSNIGRVRVDIPDWVCCFLVRSMSSAVVRIGAVVLALAQLGVSGFYAPAHRLLHHTLRTVDATKTSSPAAGCHSGCCHHHAKKADTAVNSPSDEQTPAAPCPDDENSCVWCAIALQQADPATPAAVQAALDPVEFVSTPDHSSVAARPVTGFDVRGPPTV